MAIVFITGAGYIGSALAFELRRRGYEVYVLVRSAEKAKKLVIGEIKPVIGDVLKLDTYELVVQKADIIVHTAAIIDFNSDGSFDETTVNNIKQVVSKSNAAGNPKKRFIFTSGGLIYDQPSSHTNSSSHTNYSSLTEDAPLKWNSPFPLMRNRSRLETDLLSYSDAISTIVRAPFVYGGECGRFTTFFKQGEDGKVVVEGDGSNSVPNGHIDDVVEGYVKVIEADPKVVAGQVFHFAEDAQSTFLDIAKSFSEAAGYKGEIEHVPISIPLFDLKINFDCTKAKTLLGWKSSRTRITEEAGVLYVAWKEGGYPAVLFAVPRNTTSSNATTKDKV